MSRNGSLSPDKVYAESLEGEQLVLKGIASKGIVQQITESSDDSELLSLGSMQTYIKNFDTLYDLVRGDSSFINDLTMMSTSIINQFLDVPEDWKLSGWALQHGLLNGAGGDNNNYAEVNHIRYKKAGIYFFIVSVAELPSGQIEVYLNDTWLGSILKTGNYYCEVEITDIDHDQLYLQLVDVSANETVCINSVGLYYIAPRFYSYLTEKIKKIGRAHV